MFNIGAGELTVILIVALLVLGPKRLPELARGLGKFMREFRRQTDEVRTVVEREFYRMDQDIEALPPQGTAPSRKPGPPDAAYRPPSPGPSAPGQPEAKAAQPEAPAEQPKPAEGAAPAAPAAPEGGVPQGDPPKAG